MSYTHFYTNEISLEDFIAERAEKFEKFKPHIPNGVNIVLGTEVYLQSIFSTMKISKV